MLALLIRSPVRCCHCRVSINFATAPLAGFAVEYFRTPRPIVVDVPQKSIISFPNKHVCLKEQAPYDVDTLLVMQDAYA